MQSSEKSASKGFRFDVVTKTNGPLYESSPGTSMSCNVRVISSLYSGKDGFYIYNVENQSHRTFVIKGAFPSPLKHGCSYHVSGTIEERRGERALVVDSYTLIIPTDEQGVLALLRTLNGLNISALQLYEKCGPNIIEMIQKAPERVVPIARKFGYSESRVHEWSKELSCQISEQEAMDFLSQYELPARQVEKLLRLNREDPRIIPTIKSNPYLLLSQGLGLSFETIDTIALRNGYALDCSERLTEAIICACFSLSAPHGHTAVELEALEQEALMLVGRAIGYHEANRICKAAAIDGQGRCQYKWGENTVDIQIQELSEALQKWKSDRDGSPFKFPLYTCPRSRLTEVLDATILSRRIVRVKMGESVYYQPWSFHNYEVGISKWIKKNSSYAGSIVSPRETVEKALEAVLEFHSRQFGSKIVLEDEQREAIITACQSCYGPFILTGPAGSGKSFVLKLIIQVFKLLYHKALHSVPTPRILAPTGKAAQVAYKATGVEASTIHRYASQLQSGQTASASTSHICIIDEFSMTDEETLFMLLKTMTHNVKFIVTGDVEQLHSVGAGSCLSDFIQSGVIPHVHLNTVKRQATGSGVLISANKILNGQMIQTEIVTKNGIDNNAYVYLKDTPEDVYKSLLPYIKNAGLKRFQDEEFQILCPTKKTIVGTHQLNYVAQSILNPYRAGPDGEGEGHDRVQLMTKVEIVGDDGQMDLKTLYLQVNDKVINMRNNYEAQRFNLVGESYIHSGHSGVMNGETGVVVKISRVRKDSGFIKRVVVKFSDEYVYFEDDDIHQLSLAYAITIHKSQGSQWPVIITPIIGGRSKFYTRNLLYTTYTRAQKACYVIGSEASIKDCIYNTTQVPRRTLLAEQLKSIKN